MPLFITRSRKLTFAAASLVLLVALAIGGFTMFQAPAHTVSVECEYTGIPTKYVCTATTTGLVGYGNPCEWQKNAETPFNAGDSVGFYCTDDVVKVRVYDTGTGTWSNTAMDFCGNGGS